MSEQTRKRLLIWMTPLAVMVTWAATIIGAVWTASADRTQVLREISEHRLVLTDHENRLRVLEKQSSEIATDVKWIRQTLEKRP